MATSPHVPKFGNWENDDNVPYTVYFEKARKGRGGKMINPNDPQDNPDMFANAPSPDPAPAPPSKRKAQAEELIGRGAVRSQRSSEEGNPGQFVESPARNDNIGRRVSGDHSAHHQHYGHGSNTNRPSRQSAGSEHSIERSPVHPQHQAKARGGGGLSPALDGKNSHDSSHGTPGRSRMRPTARGDETPDRGAAVPRFGEWDENNPQSADNYTHIFNKVREERHIGSSGTRNESPYNYTQKQKADNDPKGCCFPWLRK